MPLLSSTLEGTPAQSLPSVAPTETQNSLKRIEYETFIDAQNRLERT